MAFIRRSFSGSSVDDITLEIAKTTDTAFAIGDVLSWDRSANGLIRATSSHDNHGSDCLFGVCQSTQAASDTTCRVLPFQQNQIYEADCNANTASGQVGCRRILTDHDTLNNSTTDDTSAKGIFEIIKVIGAASDKKALVRIVSPAGQVTA